MTKTGLTAIRSFRLIIFIGLVFLIMLCLEFRMWFHNDIVPCLQGKYGEVFFMDVLCNDGTSEDPNRKKFFTINTNQASTMPPLIFQRTTRKPSGSENCKIFIVIKQPYNPQQLSATCSYYAADHVIGIKGKYYILNLAWVKWFSALRAKFVYE